jgi:hypothetical protein
MQLLTSRSRREIYCGNRPGLHVRGDDTPRRLYVSGRTAASIKEYICKAVVKAIAKEGRKPGSYSWLKAAKRASQVVVTAS